MKKAYHFGYQGHKPEALLAAVEEIGAILCDLRYAPFSRQPGWSKKSLSALLGKSYLHVPELGNINYKGEYGEGIRIADLEAGSKIVIDLLGQRPIVLMCVCRKFETCHRSYVVAELERYRIEVQSLNLNPRQVGNLSEMAQKTLF
jgi:uncharacterized protein (DUF488 family)